MARRKSRLLLTLWTLGLLAGCATPASPHLVTRAQHDAAHPTVPFIHEATGMVFPASIASARRTGKVVTDDQTTVYYTDSGRSIAAALTLMDSDGSAQAAGEEMVRMVNELLGRERLIAIAYGKNGPQYEVHPEGFWARLLPGQLVDGSPEIPANGGRARILIAEPAAVGAEQSRIAIAYISYPYPNDEKLSEHTTAILDAWRGMFKGDEDANTP